jgi:VanZ family protein
VGWRVGSRSFEATYEVVSGQTSVASSSLLSSAANPNDTASVRRVTVSQIQARHGRKIDIALWATTAVLALLTLLFSFGLSPPGTGTFALADKLGHGAMYFATILCFLLAAVWRPGRGDGSFSAKAPLFATGFVIAGIVVEVLQEVATPHRHAEAGDVLAEAVGAFAALAIHAWMRRTSCS